MGELSSFSPETMAVAGENEMRGGWETENENEMRGGGRRFSLKGYDGGSWFWRRRTVE